MTALPPLSGPTHMPADGSKPERIVVLLHGYGADGNDLIGLAPVLAPVLPGTAFFSPHAPYQCEMSPFGRQWFSLSAYDPELLRRNPATMQPVLQQMRDGADQVAPAVQGFLDGLMEEYDVTADKVALIGFSQGTMMSLHCALRRPAPIAGVVGFSGAMLGRDSLAQEITAKPPMLLIHGDADPVVPVEATKLAAETLGENGVEVVSQFRPGLQHGIDEEGLRMAAQFLIDKFGMAG